MCVCVCVCVCVYLLVRVFSSVWCTFVCVCGASSSAREVKITLSHVALLEVADLASLLEPCHLNILSHGAVCVCVGG